MIYNVQNKQDIIYDQLHTEETSLLLNSVKPLAFPDFERAHNACYLS